MAHSIEIKVRGYHLDLFHHVNNARYLEFLEEARWSFLEHKGGSDSLDFLERHSYVFAIVNININYRRAAYMGEILLINTSIKSVSDRSFVMYQSVVLKGTDTMVSDADVTIVIMDTRTERSVPLDGELRTSLERMVD
ncbi:MAG: thioesterase [Candidatus Contendobacter odensis]|uniref:Thioesterase n=1 Tax=Candidatus Contendibacter odensensis TaxID=1400860 RepID=A0A2G6PF93_9GAMM|nr:MAG: thioesterase [Candidatus Contendobacter odensis]